MTEPQDWITMVREETPQARRIAEWMAARHPGASILDVGCGPGLYVEAMRAIGLEAFGVDNDERLVETDWLKKIDVAGADKRGESFGPAGVVLSLEVGEHIPEVDAGHYVRFISGTNCRRLYFSAARPGQGGIGHVNLQRKDYWCLKLHRNGFYYDPEETDQWLAYMRAGAHMGWLVQNGMAFRRA